MMIFQNSCFNICFQETHGYFFIIFVETQIISLVEVMKEAAMGLYLLLPSTPLMEDTKPRQKSKLNDSHD